jgi:vacuolar-type H+-ATPase subunit H
LSRRFALAVPSTQRRATKFEELRAHGLRSEERWLAEVDRLRQEIRNARKEHEVERRQVQQAARQTQKELLEAARGRADAERALVAARTEAAALDRQLQRLAAAKPATTGKSERPKSARKTGPSAPRADAVRTRRPK